MHLGSRLGLGLGRFAYGRVMVGSSRRELVSCHARSVQWGVTVLRCRLCHVGWVVAVCVLAASCVTRPASLAGRVLSLVVGLTVPGPGTRSLWPDRAPHTGICAGGKAWAVSALVEYVVLFLDLALCLVCAAYLLSWCPVAGLPRCCVCDKVRGLFSR